MSLSFSDHDRLAVAVKDIFSKATSANELREAFVIAQAAGRFGLAIILHRFDVGPTDTDYPSIDIDRLLHYSGDLPGGYINIDDLVAMFEEFFPLNDVDLWCMDLVPEAESVVGRPIIPPGTPCAMILYQSTSDQHPLVYHNPHQRNICSCLLRLLRRKWSDEIVSRTWIMCVENKLVISDSHTAERVIESRLITEDAEGDMLLTLRVVRCTAMRTSELAYIGKHDALMIALLRQNCAEAASLAARILMAGSYTDDHLPAWFPSAYDLLCSYPDRIFREFKHRVTSMTSQIPYGTHGERLEKMIALMGVEYLPRIRELFDEINSYTSRSERYLTGWRAFAERIERSFQGSAKAAIA